MHRATEQKSARVLLLDDSVIRPLAVAIASVMLSRLRAAWPLQCPGVTYANTRTFLVIFPHEEVGRLGRRRCPLSQSRTRPSDLPSLRFSCSVRVGPIDILAPSLHTNLSVYMCMYVFDVSASVTQERSFRYVFLCCIYPPFLVRCLPQFFRGKVSAVPFPGRPSIRKAEHTCTK